MNRLWRIITENEDGTPLLGYRYAGPVAILVGIVALLRGVFR